MGSSRIRDWTHISWIGRWILYHWTTREAQSECFCLECTWKFDRMLMCIHTSSRVHTLTVISLHGGGSPWEHRPQVTFFSSSFPLFGVTGMALPPRSCMTLVILHTSSLSKVCSQNMHHKFAVKVLWDNGCERAQCKYLLFFMTLISFFFYLWNTTALFL